MINISTVYKQIYNVGTVDVGECKFQQYSYSKTLNAGTYKFIDSPSDFGSIYSSVLLNFSSNSSSYLAFRFSTAKIAGGIHFMTDLSDPSDPTGVYVYNRKTKVWTNTAYQTITLSTAQTVSADFYKWAITDGNLVKQESHTVTVEYSRGAAGYFNLNGVDLATSVNSLSFTEDATIKLYVTSGDLSTAAFGTVNVGGVDITIPDNKTIDVYKQYVHINVSYQDEHSPAELALTINYHASEQPSGETWLLNEELDSSDLPNFTVNFVSNDANFVKFTGTTIPLTESTSKIQLYYYGNSDVIVYDNIWENQAYRTLYFPTPPTGDLRTWLQANGTLQGTTAD